MECGMALFHGDKSSATSRANFSITRQRPFDNRSVPIRFNYFRGKKNGPVGRCRTEQLDRVIRRHRARRPIFAGFVHQVPGRGPIAVAIEQRSDDAAIQDTGKRFVTRFRCPFRHDLAAAHKTADVKTVRIRRSTPKARIFRRVFFLERLRFSVHHRSLRSVGRRARIGSQLGAGVKRARTD